MNVLLNNLNPFQWIRYWYRCKKYGPHIFDRYLFEGQMTWRWVIAIQDHRWNKHWNPKDYDLP